MRPFTILAAFLVLSCTAFAQGSGPNTITVPFNVSFYNDCCNERVDINGTFELTPYGSFGEFPTYRVKMSGGSFLAEFNGVYTQRGVSVALLNNYDVEKNGYVATVRIVMGNQNGCSFTVVATMIWSWTFEFGWVVTVQDYEVICH